LQRMPHYETKLVVVSIYEQKHDKYHCNAGHVLEISIKKQKLRKIHNSTTESDITSSKSNI